jgi:hypothetical protein
MQKLTVIASLVVGAFLATSCGDTTAVVTATGPTTFALVPASFSVTPSTVVAQPVRTSFCPAFPPFTAVLNLSISAGSVSVSITEISLRFVDTFGVGMPQVTLPAPVMTTQFGSALVQARQTRVFPLALGLGCGTGQRGTATVVVVIRDANGRMNSGQVSAFVH